jgi:L-methionine (R)-S-oxide reductase
VAHRVGGIVGNTDKAEGYRLLCAELDALLSGEPDAIATLANAAALIFHSLPSLNWAGFYLLREGGLVLGPFQGKPACTRIAVGQGVCGTSVARRQSILVHDVRVFPGHIACDSASRSELVVPLLRRGNVLSVLDLDSPQIGRFDAADLAGCEALAEVLLRHLPTGGVA